jgi:pimeloyl-ACP methyl ester carboxylesterase
VASGFRALPASIENTLAPYLRGGRAVFSVVMEGFAERPRSPGFQRPDSRSSEYVDFVVTQVTELRRGLDYLETRGDIDASRIAFLGPSAGSWAGVILTAIESRYRSVLFIGTDVEPDEVTDAPAANRINFAPRISAPKMMLQGRYDESAPLETEALPLFRLLREPKRLELFEGSHVPAAEISVPLISRWFDETLGRVDE